MQNRTNATLISSLQRGRCGICSVYEKYFYNLLSPISLQIFRILPQNSTMYYPKMVTFIWGMYSDSTYENRRVQAVPCLVCYLHRN